VIFFENRKKLTFRNFSDFQKNHDFFQNKIYHISKSHDFSDYMYF